MSSPAGGWVGHQDCVQLECGWTIMDYNMKVGVTLKFDLTSVVMSVAFCRFSNSHLVLRQIMKHANSWSVSSQRLIFSFIHL